MEEKSREQEMSAREISLIREFLGSFAVAAVQQPIFCNIVLRFHRDRHKPVHRCLDRFRHKLSSLL